MSAAFIAARAKFRPNWRLLLVLVGNFAVWALVGLGIEWLTR